MIKKSLAFILGLCLLLVVCGCGGSKETSGDTSSITQSATGQQTDKKAVLEIKVKSKNIEKFKSDRPYDPKKQDISIILVTGQSNFTPGVGYSSELGYYNKNQDTAPYPELPIVPDEIGLVYTSYSFDTLTELTDNRSIDEDYMLSGITPPFGTEWNSLTGTKTVFIQAAQGAVGVHEWTPHPADYECTCPANGKGQLYVKAVDNFKKAYEALSQKYNVVYTGYIWNQGEHEEVYGAVEGNTVNSSKAYYDAYKSMHDGFMSELDLDFGGISVVRADKVGDTAQNSMALTIARTAQYQLCNDIDNLFMLSTVGETCDVTMMDAAGPIHYSQATFNIMGTEMANNLYCELGLGTANAFEGVKMYAADGALLAGFDATGKLTEGKSTIERSEVSGESLIKLSALGTGHTLSYSLKVGDEDASALVTGYGSANWTELYKTHSLNKIDLKVVIE